MKAPHYTDKEKIKRLAAWHEADQKEIEELKAKLAEKEAAEKEQQEKAQGKK